MSRRDPGINKFLMRGNPAKIAILGTDQMIVLGVFGFQDEIA